MINSVQLVTSAQFSIKKYSSCTQMSKSKTIFKSLIKISNIKFVWHPGIMVKKWSNQNA